MTGKSAGYGAGYGMPGYLNPLPARGFCGWARGWFDGGRGWRYCYWATGLPGWLRAKMGFLVRGGIFPVPPFAPELSSQQEAEILRQQVKALHEEIAVLNEQISILEKATTDENQPADSK